MAVIYHVTTAAEWAQALPCREYRAASLTKEGFIHCCAHEQLAGVLERYFKGKQNLLALQIDTEKITSPIKYELSPMVHELFPHIYGPLNTDAVTGTIAL